MELFLHPVYMAAGGVLVSAPILIHLINRMRFKRVRWAAMEFLLKSQKRNRRRLIIEQLILLLLRILLVLLAAFLVARFVGAMSTPQGSTHVVVLDDTPSMADHWADGGPNTTSFEVAKEQIKQLAHSAAQAPSHQQMRIVLLSDLDTIVFDQRLSDRSAEDIDRALAPYKPSALHTDPIKGLQRAQAMLNDVAQGQKIVHFVSDFRDEDWSTGPGVEELSKGVDRLTEAGIQLSLIDTAHPYRGQTRQVALNHDNMAITDLRCENHVVAEGLETKFSVTIRNFSSSDKKNFRLHVKVDGKEAFSASQTIDRVPADSSVTEEFALVFAKKKPSEDIRPGDSPEQRDHKRRLDQEFFQITAEIDAEATGLQADNVRDLVVEVRKRVPTLVVDGTGPEGRQDGGDLFHLEAAFTAAKFAEVERCTIDELDKINLDLYPTLIFLNVGEIKSEKTLKKVQDYVRGGGSVAYFLGDKARPAFYNDVLFKKYNALFPLLIGTRPYDPLDPTGQLTPEERADKRKDRLQNDEQPKLLFPNPKHRVAETLYRNRAGLRFLSFDRYWQALPRYQWDVEGEGGRGATEVVVMPNTKSPDEYKDRGKRVGQEAVRLTKELAEAEPEAFEKYVEPVERYRQEIWSALSKPYLFPLVQALDVLRHDRGAENDPKRPNMETLWNHPKMKDLGAQIDDLHRAVLYGDPLVVTRPYGKGRVVALLTSAGTASKWNDWAGGSLSSWSYQVFMMDLQSYLLSQGEDTNRTVGDTIQVDLDAARYLPKVKRKFQPQPDVTGAKDRPEGPPAAEDQGEQSLPMTGNVLTFTFDDARRPGVYTFEFFPNVKDGQPGMTETRSYAFNIDSEKESNLRRAGRERLERARAKDSRAGAVVLRSPGDSYELFKNRQPDASESPWLYLFFLLILVVEQALAVHLSFHLKGNEAVPGSTPATAGQPAAA
jgi:hypothetical protein